MTGRILGLARHAKPHAPIETLDMAEITVAGGILGDHRGRSKGRQISILNVEDWRRAAAETGDADLPWTIRRANMLVEGLALPRTPGARLRVGNVVLEVFCETDPCARMEAARPGLRAALAPEWRGGICCRVVTGGTVRVGDTILAAAAGSDETGEP